MLLILTGVVIFLIAFNLGRDSKNKSFRNEQLKLKKEIIKNDALKKIKNGLYTKVVADTLKITELQRLADSLKLELKNPKVVVNTIYKFKELNTPVDNIKVKDSTIEISDAYPSKENPFIEYSATINLSSNKGLGKFTVNPLSISLGIVQNKNGTYSLNKKVPDFISVSSIDVQSIPIEYKTPDNFGFIVGAGAGRDFRDNSAYIILSAGIRVKKLYFEASGATNQTLAAKFKIEI